MPYGSGRKKASEWNDVDDVENDKNSVVCKHCNLVISKKIERVRAHLIKCSKKTVVVDDCMQIGESGASTSAAIVVEDDQETALQSNTSSVECSKFSDSSSSQPTTSGASPSMPKRQRSISSFVVRTSAETKDKIDMQLARFFFSANIAFRNVENKHFIKMLEVLRPGYQPPNRRKLASTLLDRVYDESNEMIQKIVASEQAPIIIIQDKWSNTQNDSIIAHSIHNGERPQLLTIVEPANSKKTAEFCASLAEEAITKVKQDFNKDVSIHKVEC